MIRVIKIGGMPSSDSGLTNLQYDYLNLKQERKTEELTALLYAIEASSVASIRYFLQKIKKIIIFYPEPNSAHAIKKVSSFSTLFYEGLVLIPEYKFQAGEHAPGP